VTRTALGRIEGLLDDRFGLGFTEDRLHVLRNAIRSRAAALGLGSEHLYADALIAHPNEQDRLAEAAVNNLSRFFRNRRQLQSILLLCRRFQSPLRAWVAGCATGEESYSLAMALLAAGHDFSIVATDISERSLAIASEGTYRSSRVEEIPQEYRDRFLQTGDRVVVGDEVRNRVAFRKHSVTDPPPVENAELVLCRNVLTYLSPDGAIRAFHSLRRSVACNGYLAIGNAETLPGNGFDPVRNAPRVYRRSCRGNGSDLP